MWQFQQEFINTMRIGIYFLLNSIPNARTIYSNDHMEYILIDNKLFNSTVQHQSEFNMEKWMHFIGNHKIESWCTHLNSSKWSILWRCTVKSITISKRLIHSRLTDKNDYFSEFLSVIFKMLFRPLLTHLIPIWLIFSVIRDNFQRVFTRKSTVYCFEQEIVKSYNFIVQTKCKT